MDACLPASECTASFTPSILLCASIFSSASEAKFSTDSNRFRYGVKIEIGCGAGAQHGFDAHNVQCLTV